MKSTAFDLPDRIVVGLRNDHRCGIAVGRDTVVPTLYGS
jgi:hypothetical protein